MASKTRSTAAAAAAPPQKAATPAKEDTEPQSAPKASPQPDTNVEEGNSGSTAHEEAEHDSNHESGADETAITDAVGDETAVTDAVDESHLTVATADGDSINPVQATPSRDRRDRRDRKKRSKRSSGVPEHRVRKSTKKKPPKVLNLDVQPGEYYLVRWKGAPNWPAIIPDDDMLPPEMLQTRPVSARRPDGTYREEYAKGGKRAYERTYPVMFLGDNSFYWKVNTDLLPCDFSKVEKKTNNAKLNDAFDIAAQGNDLAWFKNSFKEAADRLAKEAKEQAAKDKKAAAKASPEKKRAVAKAEEPQETKKSKGKRKSRATADDEDEESAEAEADAMDLDEDETKKDTKPKSKKRKKEDSDGDDAKRLKMPKLKSIQPVSTPKLRLSNPKTPNGKAPAKSFKATKAKLKASATTRKRSAAKAVAEDDEEDEEQEEQEEEKEQEEADVEMSDAPDKAEEEERVPTAEELYERKQNELLFLRHKLQRGFLTRDQPPREEEMQVMSDFITKLESYPDLDPNIIRVTKIHKVLKGIMKLSSIPKEELYQFQLRSSNLLSKWSPMLKEAEGGEPSTAADNAGKDAAGVNGVSKDDKSETDKGEHDSTSEKGQDGGASAAAAAATGDAEPKQNGVTSGDKSGEAEKPAAEKADDVPKTDASASKEKGGDKDKDNAKGKAGPAEKGTATETANEQTDVVKETKAAEGAK